MHSLGTLKEILHECGYTRRALHELGAFRGQPIDRQQAIAATSEPTSLNTLIRLFFLNVPVEASRVEAALAPFPLTELRTRGLLLAVGEMQVQSAAAIVPIGNLLTLRDFEPGETGRALKPDHVLGVGMATSMLSTLTVRYESARTLDIGTGQGFHAMVASEHSGKVIATDVNPRALDFARWSIELNGITNIELRDGSLFEPVKDEEPFDLIVSNPPFIISPPHDLVCLGGFAQGDSLVEQLVRETPKHLAEGGFACIACNWHHRADDDWASRPMAWLASSGCDAWLIETRQETAEEYIEQWMHEAQLASAGESPISRQAWQKSFDQLGARAVSLGVLILRKRTAATGRNWFRTNSLPMESCNGEASKQILRIFDNQTILQQTNDYAELADLPLGLCEDHVLTQERHGTKGGGWSIERSTLRQTVGFDFEIGLDSHAAELLGFLDGMTPSREIIAVMAKRIKSDPGHAVKQSGKFLAHLLSLGYLEVGKED